ncbi:unnamed protein product [Oncorhynchus mykiss]|uniref:Uncharacterized protein n=1 Tax=Oncorhynchus mykiss TaxID=8022 RepID=A0A060ZTD0_ONCMY|nr:unnamed protein product [Oncorhynchus mykiss]
MGLIDMIDIMDRMWMEYVVYLKNMEGACSAPSCTPCSPMHDCLATHTSNSIIELADNTTVVGLIIPTMTRQSTGWRWGPWESGARKITSHSTKQRS